MAHLQCHFAGIIQRQWIRPTNLCSRHLTTALCPTICRGRRRFPGEPAIALRRWALSHALRTKHACSLSPGSMLSAGRHSRPSRSGRLLQASLHPGCKCAQMNAERLPIPCMPVHGYATGAKPVSFFYQTRQVGGLQLRGLQLVSQPARPSSSRPDLELGFARAEVPPRGLAELVECAGAGRRAVLECCVGSCLSDAELCLCHT